MFLNMPMDLAEHDRSYILDIVRIVFAALNVVEIRNRVDNCETNTFPIPHHLQPIDLWDGRQSTVVSLNML